MIEQAPTRISHEQIALSVLRTAFNGLTGVEVVSGQGGANRFRPKGWEVTLGQQFQFGDLRAETATATVVVEVESAGGVGNLAKYWPLLALGEYAKRLVIIHVFQISSAGDYIAHRRLWGFLVERMSEDLDRRGIPYPDAWEAGMFTYRKGEEPLEAAAFLRDAVVRGGAVEAPA